MNTLMLAVSTAGLLFLSSAPENTVAASCCCTACQCTDCSCADGCCDCCGSDCCAEQSCCTPAPKSECCSGAPC